MKYRNTEGRASLGLLNSPLLTSINKSNRGSKLVPLPPIEENSTGLFNFSTLRPPKHPINAISTAGKQIMSLGTFEETQDKNLLSVDMNRRFENRNSALTIFNNPLISTLQKVENSSKKDYNKIRLESKTPNP